MKKIYYLVSFTIIMMIVLAGCGDTVDSTKKKSNKVGQLDYKEVKTINLEKQVYDLSLDEDGNTMLWNENNYNNNQEVHVWVDGKVKDLSYDKKINNVMLSRAGYIIGSEANWDADVDQRHSIFEYNPSTEETKEFIAKNGRNVILNPTFSTYLQKPRAYIQPVSNTKHDDAETYIWNIDTNTYKDLNFIHDLKQEVKGKLPSFLSFYLSKDASKVYAVVLNEGIFSYDVDSDKTEKLFTSENILPDGNPTTLLTSDENHIAYAVDNYDEGDFTYYALNIKTKEPIKIGTGTTLFTLTNGNIIIIDKNNVKMFDFGTNKLKNIYTIKLKENEKIDKVAISLDGSTIAYGYTIKGDGKNTSHLKVLRKE